MSAQNSYMFAKMIIFNLHSGSVSEIINFRAVSPQSCQ